MIARIKAILIVFTALLSSYTVSADKEEAQQLTDAFQEVEYREHSYIVFTYHYEPSYEGYGGLTHNPDCKCLKKKKKMTSEQIKQEAAKRYIEGSASYFAFIYGTEYVLEHKDNEQNKD